MTRHAEMTHKRGGRIGICVVATAGSAGIGFRPDIVAPIGAAYLSACDRLIANTPLDYHLPPLLVGMGLPFLLFWGAATLVAFGQQISGQCHLDRTLERRRGPLDDSLAHLAGTLGVAHRLVVTTDPHVYAFTAGLIRPRIYLSQGVRQLVTDDELEAVLRHELHHLRRRDPLRFFLWRLLLPLQPLLPAMRTLENRAHLAAELAADRFTADSIGTDALARAVVIVSRAQPAMQISAITAAFFATDARVAALLGRPITVKISRTDLLTSVGYSIGLVALAIWLSVQTVPLPTACAG